MEMWRRCKFMEASRFNIKKAPATLAADAKGKTNLFRLAPILYQVLIKRSFFFCISFFALINQHRNSCITSNINSGARHIQDTVNTGD